MYNHILKCFMTSSWYKRIEYSLKLISCREIQRLNQNLLVKKIYPLSCQRRFEFHTTSINLDNNKIKGILSLHENKFKQFNIVNSTDLLHTINELEKFPTFITEDNLQTLLKLIKAAVKLEYDPNFDIIKNFWELASSIQESNLTEELLYDFLQLCLKSSYEISCQNVMDVMEQNYIPLSKRLGEILIANLCIQGKSQEAEEMILALQSRGQSVSTENIYASLLLLKGKKKELDGLEEILCAMKSANIDFSPLSKSALVIAYNNCGEFSEAKKVLSEVAESESIFNFDQYKQIILSAIENGALENDESYLAYIADSKSDLAGDVALKEVVMQLIRTNYIQEAILLLTLDQTYAKNSHMNVNASDFIKELISVKHDEPLIVLDFCDKVVRNDLNLNAYEVALEVALIEKRIPLAWKLFKAVKTRRVLKEHLFWPLFSIKDNNDDNVAKTLEILSKMSDLNVNIGIETLLHHVFPSISLECPELTIQMLRKVGVSKTKVMTPVLSALLREKRYAEAVNLAKDCGVSFSMSNLILNPLALSYRNDSRESVEIFFELLHYSKEFETMKRNTVDRFASQVRKISKGNIREHEVKDFIRSLKKYSVYLEEENDTWSQYKSKTPSKTFEKTERRSSSKGRDHFSRFSDEKQIENWNDQSSNKVFFKEEKKEKFPERRKEFSFRSQESSGMEEGSFIHLDENKMANSYVLVDEMEESLPERRNESPFRSRESSGMEGGSFTHPDENKVANSFIFVDKEKESLPERTEVPFRSRESSRMEGGSFIHPNDMTVEELEAHLKELKEKNMNPRGVLRKLLLKYSKINNVERVEEITQELQTLEMSSSPGMMSTFLYNKVLEGNGEDALKMFYTLYNTFPNFIVDTHKVVELCCLLVRLGKVQECVDLMRDYIKTAPRSYHNKKSVLRNCHQFLTECSEIEGYAFARQMCSLILNGGLVDPSSIIFGPLIKSKLKSNELDEAVKEAEEIFAAHKILPMRVEILVNILQSNDPSVSVNDLVDRMCALIAKDRGLPQARQDLLAAALRCKNKEQVEEIYKFVEDSLDKHKIQSLCDYFVQTESTDPLHMLLSVSKGSEAIDRFYICESLLNIYYVNRKSKEALELSTFMQEEFLIPTPSFSNKLNALLKSTAATSTSPLI